MQKNAPEMSAITISRQYGSGGGEVAAYLAQRLGWLAIPANQQICAHPPA